MSSTQNSISQTHHPPPPSPPSLLPPSSTILPSSLHTSSLFIPSSPCSSLLPPSPSTIIEPSSTLHHVSSSLFHPSSSSLLFPRSLPLLHPSSFPPSSIQLPPPSSLLAIKSNHIFCSPFLPPFSGYLLIGEGRVEGLSEEPPTSEYKVLDRSDDYVIPGLIDLHVHLNATSEWEEIENVTKMAVKGGVTTILDHPVFNEYDQNMNESKTLKERIAKISSQTYTDVGILAYLGPHNLANLWNLWENEPILGFNIFLSPCLQPSLPHFDQNQLKILQKTLLNKGNREEGRRVEDGSSRKEEEFNRRKEKVNKLKIDEHNKRNKEEDIKGNIYEKEEDSMNKESNKQMDHRMKINEIQMEEELIKEERNGLQNSKKDELNQMRSKEEDGSKKDRTNGRRMLLSVHPEYATARDLFMSSPLRTKKLEDRLDLELEILDEGKFGGGIAGDLDPNESGGEEEEENDDYNELMLEYDNQLVPPSYTRSRLLKRLSFRNAKKQEEQGISRLEMIGYSLNEEEMETIRREDEEEGGRMEEGGGRREEDKMFEEDGGREEGSAQERLGGKERGMRGRRRGDGNGEEGGGEWEEEVLTSSSDEEEAVDSNDKKGSAAIAVEKMKIIWNKDGEQSKEPKHTFKTNILINGIRGILNSIKQDSPTSSPTLPPTIQCLSSYPPPPSSCSPSLLPLPSAPPPNSTPPSSLPPIPSYISSSLSSSPVQLSSLSPPPAFHHPPHLSLLERRQKLSKSLGPMDKSFLHDFHIDIKEVKKKKTEIISKNNDKTNRDYNFFLYNHSLSWEMNGVKLCLRNFKKVKQTNFLFSELSSTSSAFEVQEKKKYQNFLPFYTEITIPFLCFHRKLIKPGKTKFKNSPPIRDKETRDLIIEGLLVDDLIHVISSGHNTQDPKLKKVDHSNFRRAVNGISCIGCNLNVVWSTLYSKWKDTCTVEELIQRTISLTSYNAALLGGLSDFKGSLQPGKHADFVIWKPFKVTTLNDENILLRNKRQFVFRKRKFYGEVLETFLRGEKVYEKERFFFKKGEVIGKKEEGEGGREEQGKERK